MIITFFASLLQPPEFIDSARARSAQLLHIILLVFIVVAISLTVVDFLGWVPSDGRLWIASAALFSLLGLFGLMRRGYIRLTSWLLTILIAAIMVTVHVRDGDVESPVYIGYLLLVFLATSLLGFRSGVFYLGLELVVLFIIATLQQAGLLVPTPTPLNRLFFVYASFLVSTGVAIIIVKTVRDHTITDLDDTRKALADAEMRWRFALEGSSDGIWDYDLVNQQYYFSSRWREMVGIGGEGEVSAVDLWEQVVLPEDRAAASIPFHNHLVGKIPIYIAEHRVRLPDGGIRWMLGRGKVMEWTPDGKPARMVGTLTDISLRKQMELELRQTQERFELALSSSPIVVYTQNTDLRYTWIYNPDPEFPLDTAIGKTDAELLRKEDAERLMDIKRQVIQTGKGLRHQTIYMTLSRGLVHYDLNIEPITDEQGKVIGLTSASVDITELRRAQDELRASEQRYRELFADNPHPMWIFDQGTLRFLEVNQAGIARYGYSRAEFLSMTIRDIRPVEDMPRLEEHLNQRSGEFRYGDIWTHRRKDGSHLIVDIAAHDLTFDDRPATLIVAYDITARVQAEEALMRSRELVQKVFDRVPAAILIVSAEDKRILNVNPYFTALLGYERNEVVGKTIGELLAQQDDPSVPLFLGNSTPETQHDLQQYWRTKAGESRTILISSEPVDIDGRLALLGIAVDVTERQEWEERRRDSEKLLNELQEQRRYIELREGFVHKMSHEFRTPLTAIRTASETLKAYWDRMTPEKREENFKRIDSQILRAVRLLDEVMVLGRARSGRMTVEPAPLDLIGYCRGVIQLIHDQDENQHPIQFQATGDLDDVLLDARMLDHILLNLLSNAVKYSPPGLPVEFNLTHEDKAIVFQVKDSGIGIPEAEQASLFETFFRATNVRSIKGNGLGLAIVKETVGLCGGSITFESDEQNGTLFMVRLPMTSSIEQPTPM